MAEVHDQGDVVTASAVFTASGVAVDPTTVTVRVAPPGFPSTTYTYGVDAELVRDDTGEYHIDIDTSPAAGTWWVYWVSTGTGQASEAYSFPVQALPQVVGGVSRKALRHEMDMQLRTSLGAGMVERTATGGSTSTVVDTARTEPDDYWSNSWLYISSTLDGEAPEDEESVVSDYSAVDKTFTLTPGLTAAVAAGDKYELRRYFSAGLIHSTLNQALEEAAGLFPEYVEDESLVIQTDVYDYDIPDVIDVIQRIDVLNHNVEYRGTATDGTSTTLEDTEKTWTVDALADMEVAIYDGTGAGQYRTIDSNTADTITVTSAWVTTPDSTSKYVIKDLSDPPGLYRITRANMIGQALHLQESYPEGQRLRITYLPVHTDMVRDSDVTTLPKTYVIMVAMKHLLLMAPTLLPEGIMSQRAMSTHDRLEARIERYVARNQRHNVPGTYWNRGGKRRWKWTSPSREMIGDRKED